MSVFTRGFHGRRSDDDGRLPPGQYLTDDFPVLSAGPTPQVALDAGRSRSAPRSGDEHALVVGASSPRCPPRTSPSTSTA